MEYCRKLEFTEEPNYKYLIGLFDQCAKRHDFDFKLADYTWKQNRLHRDKEALKASVGNIIAKSKNEEGKFFQLA